ncbi:hypothetical protein [Erwinia tasmaniensis]|uniref:Uncharacterized protein n=1 Tax=Erwinia tasmaniensis (strain DSM 17950 / CFBP 7177 / CIP 109463 / NCPPB 4357 / Et1/99) TaxID=465817 RepID=B2VJW1_ERWT9|nr:hypothetical protein [Erwinia tasmaniensis]CAO98245.1 Hypothetical protein ETA_31990 [Erwinia tasmaniensis Et1/99]
MKKLILASLLVTQPLLAATPDYSSLQGTWQVDAVKVADSPVQAVVDNDPQYMGAEVTFSADKIVWNKGTPQRPIDPSIDNCLHKPTLTVAGKNDPEQGYQIDDGFTVLCGAEPWGPGAGAVVTRPENGMLTLFWYDGAILSLKKVVD